MNVSISNRLLTANTEDEVSFIYNTCCVKLDGLFCPGVVEFFIEDYVLCKTHYLLYLKNSYNNCEEKSEKYSNDIVKIIKSITSEIFTEKDDFNNIEIVGKFNNIYILRYKQKLIKFCYKKNSPDLLKLDYNKFKEISENDTYILSKKFITKKNDHESFKIGKKKIEKTENVKFYVYSGIDYSLNTYMRYCSTKRKKEFIRCLAVLVKKYHKKGYTVGHFSKLNIGVINEEPVFTSFFSFSTFTADYLEDFIDADKCQNIMCDILTGSIRGLQLKFTDKFCDLEMIMWFYLNIINHPIMSKMKDKDGNILSLGKIINIKQKFICEVYADGLLCSLNANNRNKFSIIKEVDKILNYF